MALSHEDKKDVKNALGKAMANKIHKVTTDSKKPRISEGTRKWLEIDKTSMKPGSAAHIQAHGMQDIPMTSPRGQKYWDSVKKATGK